MCPSWLRWERITSVIALQNKILGSVSFGESHCRQPHRIFERLFFFDAWEASALGNRTLGKLSSRASIRLKDERSRSASRVRPLGLRVNSTNDNKKQQAPSWGFAASGHSTLLENGLQHQCPPGIVSFEHSRTDTHVQRPHSSFVFTCATVV